MAVRIGLAGELEVGELHDVLEVLSPRLHHELLLAHAVPGDAGAGCHN